MVSHDITWYHVITWPRDDDWIRNGLLVRRSLLVYQIESLIPSGWFGSRRVTLHFRSLSTKHFVKWHLLYEDNLRRTAELRTSNYELATRVLTVSARTRGHNFWSSWGSGGGSHVTRYVCHFDFDPPEFNDGVILNWSNFTFGQVQGGSKTEFEPFINHTIMDSSKFRFWSTFICSNWTEISNSLKVDQKRKLNNFKSSDH